MERNKTPKIFTMFHQTKIEGLFNRVGSTIRKNEVAASGDKLNTNLLPFQQQFHYA